MWIEGSGRRPAIQTYRGAYDLILALMDRPPISRSKNCASPFEQGLRFGFGTIRRFFKRRRITCKKSPRMRASRTGQIL